jgi:hypothetical protein
LKWGPIYDDPNYWTEKKLAEQAVDFRYGVATVCGSTGLSDEQGPLFHNVLDIDSDAAHDNLLVLMNPGPKCSIIKRIFEQGCVVKTTEPKRYQIHWFSHKQNKPVHTQDCKPGYEFEIHTDNRNLYAATKQT